MLKLTQNKLSKHQINANNIIVSNAKKHPMAQSNEDASFLKKLSRHSEVQ